MMESTGGSSGPLSATAMSAAMPSPSVVADNSKVFCSSLFKATNYEFDPSISEEEKRFYLKAYPTVDVVRERKTHCTVCKIHIGTAPVQENGIKMHPILRVTHCNKCHDFYNSGEFSKGEDGSELYCRWCGQGGEVYCCSSCPYVFCKSCIVKNLSRGVVADIEQNENWNCFSCAPKILWPLRAQHWALMNYIEQQKKEIYALNLSELELKQNLSKDRSKCCRLAKAKCGNMSDSMESLDSVTSKRSHSSANSAKKPMKHAATPSPQQMNAKRAKTNDEVVCTPDLLSMLEPDCQITVSPKPNRPVTTPSASTPKIMSIQQPQSGYNSMSSTPKNTAPPPLVLRNTAIKLRPTAPPPVVRRTIIGPRTPNPGGNGTPVYHTINGYRIDLNSAAQQETFRLPNGKLIQVKRQGPPAPQNSSPSPNNWQQMSSPQPQRVIPQTIASRAVQITQHPYNITVQQQQNQHPQVIRYHSNMVGSTTINPINHNGTTIQVLNGQMSSGPQHQPQQQQQQAQQVGPIRPVMVRHVFPDNPIGQARSGLQDQVFNAMEICTHLTNKVQTLTNSNAYKQARSFLEVKELYIHLSYLLTYAIGRFKSLQDKCLGDMRTLGFGNDADCLENGQLAADKQASDDEDNEIEIVEPKTDLITLDSDDDESPASTPNKTQPEQSTNEGSRTQEQVQSDTLSNTDAKTKTGMTPVSRQNKSKSASQGEGNVDLMSMAQNFLASMLEVDVNDGPLNSPGSDSSGQKKQPRKKLTNKPNPTLLKQKALMERERLEEMKRNDQKLKMKCSVELKKAEEEFPYAKEMLEAKVKEKQAEEEEEEEEYVDHEETDKKVTLEKSVKESENQVKLLVETEKETLEVEVFVDDVGMNSSTEENNKVESNDLHEKSKEEIIGRKTDNAEETVENDEVFQEEINKTCPEQIEEKQTTVDESTDIEKSAETVEDPDKDKPIENIQENKIKSVVREQKDEFKIIEINDKDEKRKEFEKSLKLTENLEEIVAKSGDEIQNSSIEIIKNSKINGIIDKEKLNENVLTDKEARTSAEEKLMKIDDEESPEIPDGIQLIETKEDEEVDVDKEIEKVLELREERNENHVVTQITESGNSTVSVGTLSFNSNNEVVTEIVNKTLNQNENDKVETQEITIPSIVTGVAIESANGNG